MTKSELVDHLVKKSGIENKAAVGRAIDAFLSAIKDTVNKDRRFTLSGFGTFYLSKRKARQGRNPKTGAPIAIPAMEVMRFKASMKVRRRV